MRSGETGSEAGGAPTGEGPPAPVPNDMAAPITVLLIVFGSFVAGLILLGLSLALG